MAVFNQQFNCSPLPCIFAHAIAEVVIVTRFSLCRHSFNFMPLHVGIMVDKVTMEQIFLCTLILACQYDSTNARYSSFIHANTINSEQYYTTNISLSLSLCDNVIILNKHALYYRKRVLHEWMCTNVLFPYIYILQECAKGTYPYTIFSFVCFCRQGYQPCQTEIEHYVRTKFCHYWDTSFREDKKYISQNFIGWFCLSYRI